MEQLLSKLIETWLKSENAGTDESIRLISEQIPDNPDKIDMEELQIAILDTDNTFTIRNIVIHIILALSNKFKNATDYCGIILDILSYSTFNDPSENNQLEINSLLVMERIIMDRCQIQIPWKRMYEFIRSIRITPEQTPETKQAALTLMMAMVEECRSSMTDEDAITFMKDDNNLLPMILAALRSPIP